MNKDPHGVARSMEQETDLRDEMEDTVEREAWIAAPWAFFTVSTRAGSSYKTDARLASIIGIITIEEAQLLEPLSDFSMISNQ